MTAVVGLILWERRHAVRAELPGRTLCGIPTGLVHIDDVPGLTDFAGAGVTGFDACRRCLPMWRRVVHLKGSAKVSEIAADTRSYRNVAEVMGCSAASV